MQRWGERAPVSVDGSHHRARQHHGLYLAGDFAQLRRVRAHDPVSDRKRRIWSEHQLRDPDTRLRGQPLCDGLTKAELEGFARLLTVGQYHDLCKRRVRQLRGHRQVEARRALPHIGRDDFCVILLL
ncbi:hypothetical protein D3C73_999810 [compost metagenome]